MNADYEQTLPKQFTLDISFDHPNNQSLTKHFSVPLTLICGFFLGFGDACWNTQIGAFLVVHYSDRSAQAFSLFRFFQVSVFGVQAMLSRRS